MKHILTLMLVALFFMTACNNVTKTEEKKNDTTVVKTEVKAPEFTPYKARMVELTVKDYNNWYDGFKKTDSLPKAYGLTQPGVARELDNDKKILVFANVADEKKSKEFDNLPARKENMKKGGVTNSSTPTYWNVIMDDTSHIEQSERVMIVHHVKDYDTWKKVFDQEGMETRKANGFYERAIARSIDDPNTVCLIMAITDMQKLKARIASPELKKIMEDAGVEGAPTITYFKWVNM